MSFQGKENCELAEYLFEKITDLPSDKTHLSQAMYRAIISRAYYGSFIETREYFGIRDNSGSVHSLVKNRLKNEDRRTGNNLSSLLQLRKKADYNNTVGSSARESKESTRLASNILAYIESKKT